MNAWFHGGIKVATTLTIICDNGISRPGLVGEHGFSVLIERDGKTLLFDTGPGMSLPINFKALGKDPASVDKIILSHGHYDHTGGLKWIVEQAGGSEIIAHPAVFSRHMVRDSDNISVPSRFIGCPFSRRELEELGARFTLMNKTGVIEKGITFLTGYALDPEKVALDKRLVLGDGLDVDPMADDASLLIDTKEGPVLLLGCAHAGVLNIMDYIKKALGITGLKAVLGGTHLMFYGEESLSQLMDKFDEFGVDVIGVSHCTGMQAALKLAARFGQRFAVASAGCVFRWDGVP
jgi:7,8-dihydropterin-6-yl-methyl-4-(beta-D-ribofuranosyl)aminobenzene 5'-phosphate synthase